MKGVLVRLCQHFRLQQHCIQQRINTFPRVGRYRYKLHITTPVLGDNIFGRELVLDAIREPGLIGWAWSAILIGSLLTIIGFARAGSVLFWKSTAITVPDAEDGEPEDSAASIQPPLATVGQVAPVMLALAVLGGLAIFAGPVSAYLDNTSAQLFDRAGYVEAVLSPVEER